MKILGVSFLEGSLEEQDFGKAKFWFEAYTLDSNHWVVDFGGLKELKHKLLGFLLIKLPMMRNVSKSLLL